MRQGTYYIRDALVAPFCNFLFKWNIGVTPIGFNRESPALIQFGHDSYVDLLSPPKRRVTPFLRVYNIYGSGIAIDYPDIAKTKLGMQRDQLHALAERVKMADSSINLDGVVDEHVRSKDAHIQFAEAILAANSRDPQSHFTAALAFERAAKLFSKNDLLESAAMSAELGLHIMHDLKLFTTGAGDITFKGDMQEFEESLKQLKAGVLSYWHASAEKARLNSARAVAMYQGLNHALGMHDWERIVAFLHRNYELHRYESEPYHLESLRLAWAKMQRGEGRIAPIIEEHLKGVAQDWRWESERRYGLDYRQKDPRSWEFNGMVWSFDNLRNHSLSGECSLMVSVEVCLSTESD